MKKVTFRASVRKGHTPSLVTGWQLQCGAVVHRRLPDERWGQCDDAWTVSDPVTGCSIVHGWSMGEAVSSYRRLKANYGAGFPAALAVARQNTARRIAAERASS
jgi:hypothetical protein